MTERDGIFAGDDPFAIIRAWMAEAEKAEPNDANAMQLATVDADGLPNVRTLLLKEIESDGSGDGGFLFYTNYSSAKGKELDAAGKAAFVMHWKSLRRQVRARGVVEREDGKKADTYYRSRPLGSRIGAWASRQSAELTSRAELMEEVARRETELGTDPARPPFWGGYRLRPIELEFWADGESRLHDRYRWERTLVSGNWNVIRLHP